jgi:hypothetical protein
MGAVRDHRLLAQALVYSLFAATSQVTGLLDPAPPFSVWVV